MGGGKAVWTENTRFISSYHVLDKLVGFFFLL